MTILRFLLHEPLRRRIRLLQAELELLASRVEHLEQALEAAASRIPKPGNGSKLPSASASALRRPAPSFTARWSPCTPMRWN
ncbi:hypothetical protein HMSSN139_10820 [Paenibacillus sp. HMSSN-139]|nr:hypothetical protein HMSSN139_10820 [Paenibacillus sp. HMSSN-139]